MSILFRCPRCDKRLSIAERKAGTHTFCPNCNASVAVPIDDAPPTELPELPPRAPIAAARPLLTESTSSNRWMNSRVRLGAVAGCLIALMAIIVVAASTLRNPAPPDVVRNDTPPTPALPAESLVIPPSPTSTPPQKPTLVTAPAPHAVEHREDSSQKIDPIQPSAQPAHGAPQQSLTLAPPPRPIVHHQPAILPAVTSDQFGNPVGPDVGLGRYGEFKGKKLLFWSGYENAGRVFFGPTNPLWKAWERQGFTVRVEFGQFKTEWLRDIDQLWIVSTGKFELPLGLPPEAVVAAVDFLPASEIPSNFTAAEYKFIVRATLDMSLSRVHPLNQQAYHAIEKFANSGKGLCLLSDDEPFVIESNELARRLYGVAVKGNYIADKIAYVRERNLTPAEIRKFKGQYEVADHPLLKGVNFLYEGITISNVGESDKLDVALKASDGKPLIAVSKVPGQRVVIDCAFTQFCHGPTERTSYILKSAGAVRLAQNIAAYLAGKEGEKR